MTKHRAEIDALFAAELQFRLASAVRLASSAVRPFQPARAYAACSAPLTCRIRA